MLTRRTFFGTLAALAVAPRVAPVVAAPIPPVVEWKDRLYTIPAPAGGYYVFSKTSTWHVVRDDGDTILELR